MNVVVPSHISVAIDESSKHPIQYYSFYWRFSDNTLDITGFNPEEFHNRLSLAELQEIKNTLEKDTRVYARSTWNNTSFIIYVLLLMVATTCLCVEFTIDDALVRVIVAIGSSMVCLMLVIALACMRFRNIYSLKEEIKRTAKRLNDQMLKQKSIAMYLDQAVGGCCKKTIITFEFWNMSTAFDISYPKHNLNLAQGEESNWKLSDNRVLNEQGTPPHGLITDNQSYSKPSVGTLELTNSKDLQFATSSFRPQKLKQSHIQADEKVIEKQPEIEFSSS